MKRKFSFFNLHFLIYIFFSLLIFYIFFINLRNSLFFKRRDRLNLVFYGKKTAFYSFGFDDQVNYAINLPADIKILVPGGFGYYRLGALGKLAALEKNPQLYKKALSAGLSTFIDYYFYPAGDQVFYGKQAEKIFFPNFWQIFSYKTNANVFDRAYIFFLFIFKQKNNFLLISYLPQEIKSGEIILDEKKFFDQLLGRFYCTTYRNEEKTVKIVYTKREKNALLVAKIIEGQGIRVVDLSFQENNANNCRVIEEENRPSKTAQALSSFFNCPIIKGRTNPYDIIFILGEKEGEWKVE